MKLGIYITKHVLRISVKFHSYPILFRYKILQIKGTTIKLESRKIAIVRSYEIK